jgi:hypothetical protein
MVDINDVLVGEDGEVIDGNTRKELGVPYRTTVMKNLSEM